MHFLYRLSSSLTSHFIVASFFYCNVLLTTFLFSKFAKKMQEFCHKKTNFIYYKQMSDRTYETMREKTKKGKRERYALDDVMMQNTPTIRGMMVLAWLKK